MLNQLYAAYLGCDADKPVAQYTPNVVQTPKPERIKRELRKAIADKTEKAITDARREVFRKYLDSDNDLESMMSQFEGIQRIYSSEVEWASKQLASASSSDVPLSRRHTATYTELDLIGTKVILAREEVSKLQAAEKAKKKNDKKEKKATMRQAGQDANKQADLKHNGIVADHKGVNGEDAGINGVH